MKLELNNYWEGRVRRTLSFKEVIREPEEEQLVSVDVEVSENPQPIPEYT